MRRFGDGAPSSERFGDLTGHRDILQSQIAVLAVITAQHGIAGLQLATLMAGIILMGMGAARLGSVIRYIPDPVIVGFTSGIGLIIFVGQWKDFLGLDPAASGVHFHAKLAALVQALPTLNWATTLLGVIALLTLLVGTRYLTSGGV